MGARLGAKLDARGRERFLAARPDAAPAEGEPAPDAAAFAGARLLVVDAAPKVVVEGLFAVAGAVGALCSSPALAPRARRADVRPTHRGAAAAATRLVL